MTTNYHEHSVELVADEGKVLYNGADYTTAISLPLGQDISAWTETDPPSGEDEITADEALDIIIGQN